jgi:hypothetical protein
MSLAPVVLFVYNRPEHTRRTLEALQLDPLAAQSELVVYADGPRRDGDRSQIAAVRELFEGLSGFKSVNIRASGENRGLAASIIDGVTEVISNHGRAIVLEDDLVVSPQFLTYMNGALDYYADEETVMHISGYWFPIDLEMAPGTFFLRVPSSWGWATWARAWQCFEKNPKELKCSFTHADIRRFNLDGANDFWEQVLHNCQGKANTWAIFWYAAIFRNNGLCLFPAQSLVENIGTDGSGVHCLVTDIYRSRLAGSRVDVFKELPVENLQVLEELKKFYRQNRIGKVKRFVEVNKIRLRKLVERNR